MNEWLTRGKQKTKVVSLEGLHRWNVGLAVVYILQTVAIIYGQLLNTSKLFPIQIRYLTLNPIYSELAGRNVSGVASQYAFNLNLIYLVALVFLVAAIVHSILALSYRKRYEANLKKRVNQVRWFEYAFSAGLMMVVIAVLTGIADLSSLVMIFAFELIMSLLWLSMEAYNRGNKKPNWLAYIIGSIAGLVPWLIILMYAWAANIDGNGGTPGFVYWIYLSMFIVFSGFAVNMLLQYKKVGKWADYLYCERNYMILGLVAKTLLAWQLFAGTLHL